MSFKRLSSIIRYLHALSAQLLGRAKGRHVLAPGLADDGLLPCRGCSWCGVDPGDLPNELWTECDGSGRYLPNTEAERQRQLAYLKPAAKPPPGTCVTDLVAGRPRPLNGDNGRQMAVQLGQRRRLVFCANHNLVPATKLGGVDWSKVSRVKILRIEEDHE